MDNIQKEHELFLAMAPGLVSELIASKTKKKREFVTEKIKQGKVLLKKNANPVMQFICSLATEHSGKL